MTPIGRRAFMFAAGALLLAACGSTGSHGGTGDDHDRDFIDGMVPHHQAAIEMAKVAQRKAERAELKQLADAIVADQEGEIARMKARRKEIKDLAVRIIAAQHAEIDRMEGWRDSWYPAG